MDYTSIVLSVLSGIIGAIVSTTIYHIKFAQNIIERLTRMETKVAMMCNTINELKKDLEELRDEVKLHGEELAKLT